MATRRRSRQSSQVVHDRRKIGVHTNVRLSRRSARGGKKPQQMNTDERRLPKSSERAVSIPLGSPQVPTELTLIGQRQPSPSDSRRCKTAHVRPDLASIAAQHRSPRLGERLKPPVPMSSRLFRLKIMSPDRGHSTARRHTEAHTRRTDRGFLKPRRRRPSPQDPTGEALGWLADRTRAALAFSTIRSSPE